ncbi:pyruvate dehydrogenase E1 component subunit alpha, somatic form, mitochondrial-like isoform X5 [Phascolarctos cinereus]
MMLRLILRNVTFIGLRMNLPPQQFSLERKDSSIIRSCRLSCRMELKADQLYKQKIIRGFCHLYDGQRRLLVPEASGNLSDAGLTFRHLTCFDCCFPYYFYWILGQFFH